VAEALKANGIETRPLGGGSMARQPFWGERYETQAFQVADRIHATSFMLPNHALLDPEDIQAICDTVLAVKRRG
jgi:dTDP-4-amino-4,6-dideoxygalactose transaminase